MDIIGLIINIIIAALGVGILVALIWISGRLTNLTAALEQQFFGTKGRFFKDQKTLALKQQETAIAVRENTYGLRREFDDLCARHTVASQLIPLFPLLGILGTVAGLMQQVNADQLAEISASLGTALTTTFWGLMASIILKAVETLLVQRKESNIEAMLNDYDIKYQDAVDISSAADTEE